MKSKNIWYFMMATVILILIPILQSYEVSASTSSGGGGSASGGDGYYRLSGNGIGGSPNKPSVAWNDFRKSAGAGKVNRAFNRGGVLSGAKANKNSRYSSLINACKSSEFIWYFSNFENRNWNTKAGSTHKFPVQNNFESKWVWDRFINPRVSPTHAESGWGKRPGVILVCSEGLMTKNITVTAKSATKTYNGKSQSVSGITNTRPSGIASGHRVVASNSGAKRTVVGTTKTKVGSVKVVDSKNRNVTNQYRITKRDGNLRVKKRTITITAKSSLNNIYTGDPFSVSGITTKKPKGIVSGHTVSAKASAKRTKPGTSNVTFSGKPVVRNKSGKVVTKNYTVNTRIGKLKVYGLAAGDGAKRCFVDTKNIDNDKASAIVSNDINVAVGYIPLDKEELDKKWNDETLTSGMFTVENEAGKAWESKPEGGTSKSDWNAWKTKFENGGKGKENLRTVELPLSAKDNSLVDPKSLSELISEHGGVLNVTRTHNINDIEVVFCQPQEREMKINPDKDKTNAVWGKYKDKGEKIIAGDEEENEKHAVKTGKGIKQFSYQIVGSNCNVTGLDKLKADSNVEFEQDHSFDKGTASWLIETKEKPGVNFLLGKNHYTGEESFYEADDSCKDSFKESCTAEKLTTAEHDAKNNIGDNPLFTQSDISEDNTVGSDGVLNFFRDNKDREVRSDVWYPKGTSEKDLIVDKNEKAKSTVAHIFGGTPEKEITTIEGIGGDSINVIGEDVRMNGHINKLNIKSQWASESGKPYEVGLNWIYEGKAFQNVLDKVDGYEVTETEESHKPFEVHCQFLNDKSMKQNARVPKNPFENGKIDVQWNDENSIRAIFTRSVSDKITKETEKEERQ